MGKLLPLKIVKLTQFYRFTTSCHLSSNTQNGSSNLDYIYSSML